MPVRGRLVTLLLVPWLLPLSIGGCHEALNDRSASPTQACPQTPQAIARMDRRSAGFVLDEGSAYLSMNGLWRVAKTGGELQPLTPEGPTGVLARSGDQLFWTEGAFRQPTVRLFTTPRQGGEQRLLGAGLSAPAYLSATLFGVAGLAVTADHVVVLLAGLGHQLVWLDRTSGDVASAVGNGGSGRYSLIGDEAGVFLGTASSVDRVQPRGAGSTREAAPRGFALDGTHLYWRDQAGALGFKAVRAPRADLHTVEVLGDVSPEDSFALAVDEAFLYWTDPRGRIERLPKAGGGAAVLVTAAGAFDDDDHQAALAVDGDSVYWYAGAPGARASDDEPLWLMRACKAPAR